MPGVQVWIHHFYHTKVYLYLFTKGKGKHFYHLPTVKAATKQSFNMNRCSLSCRSQILYQTSPTVPWGWKRYFVLKKMSFDFHILYDFIIHTLQNWLPVNLITVTPISHKYANTIQACRVLPRTKRDFRQWLAEDASSNLKSSLLKTCTFYEVSRFPQQHVLPKHSMLACHSKFNHTKMLSSLLLLSGFVSTVVKTEAERVKAQQRQKTIPANLMKIIS